MAKCFHCHRTAMPGYILCQAHLKSAAAASQRTEQQAGAEPVAWRYKDARGHWRYRGYVPNFDVEYSILKPEPLFAHPPAAEPKGMREALEDAARSLETISKLAGGTEYMLCMSQVRGYAGSRALGARAALADDQKGEA
jgi:hypothetical protein